MGGSSRPGSLSSGGLAELCWDPWSVGPPVFIPDVRLILDVIGWWPSSSTWNGPEMEVTWLQWARSSAARVLWLALASRRHESEDSSVKLPNTSRTLELYDWCGDTAAFRRRSSVRGDSKRTRENKPHCCRFYLCKEALKEKNLVLVLVLEDNCGLALG